MYSIGVDIGGSHIASCMFEHTNKTICKETWVSRKVDTMDQGDIIIDQWVCAISKTIELCNKEIDGIGIAMPGPFNYYEGISRIRDVSKLEALYGVNIRAKLAKRLKMNPLKIRFINDAAAFSIAEALVGRASSFQKVVAITLGTGFGASFLQNGYPLIDAHNVPVGGCLYDKPYQGRIADDVFSTRGIIGCYKDITGNSIGNVRQLTEKASSEEDAAKVLARFGTDLGNFLAPYLMEFQAEVLVIGGNISKANAFFLSELQSQLPQIEIYISEFGEEAAIIGGSLLIEDDFYHRLTPTIKLM